MTRVIVICGLPGSGKSHYARERYPDLPLFDDPGRQQGCTLKDIHDALITGKDFVLTDPMFCREKDRIGLEAWLYRNSLTELRVEWVWFENDPETCKANASHPDREGKPVMDLIDQLSEIYCPPRQALPCWKPRS